MKKDTIENQLTRRIKTAHALHEKTRKAIEALSKAPRFNGQAPLMDRLLDVSNALNAMASNLETDLAELKNDPRFAAVPARQIPVFKMDELHSLDSAEKLKAEIARRMAKPIPRKKKP